ncbi:5'-nucleotidase /3'-nucleotidase /exopolyphosphatase [Draconibacterium orientale]|uniref:5'-nucleotidase SurE n=1 Tax=Draconibacterium orientale TaxID=1168034 RepID=X5DEX3_9BACT|nr:5'/3'-nucleotidase SurE [Draconibacterium orientale]AHW58912.1 stationary phase survival protein SurE [Draconibacterium orientale]SEU14008.1 5'-nucleotidase /3'-nucleotidase /exopolyphosphatase [Draconibacterium orientale]
MQKNDSEKPLILVTNDDGIHAKGLRELVEVMQFFGDVVVISSEVSMSGKACGITVDQPLRATPVEKIQGVSTFKCNGTPVDSVKLSFNGLFERIPDYVVSGINHGSNASISVIYSGTMGAAIEGGLHGVPSIGFSLEDYSPDADFSKAKLVVARVFQSVIENGIPPFTCLNVNIPKGKPEGIKVCRQAHGKWMGEFEKRTDPHGREYHWLSGYFQNLDEDTEDTDIFALENNFATVVPVRVDMTCYETMEQIKSWKF